MSGDTDRQDDKFREILEGKDRWCADHDRACAFLLTEPGLRLLCRTVEDDLGPLSKLPEAQLELRELEVEKPIGRGSIDVFARYRFGRGSSTNGRVVICEVKSQRVVGGEVIRQLLGYERQLEDPMEVVLVLAHVMPLSIPAAALLAHAGIATIFLGGDDAFERYAPAKKPG